MARTYHEMPPLWWLQEHLELTSDCPSGLKWKTAGRLHEPGDQAGVLRSDGRFYTISLLGTKYPAHRVVYYLRTGTNPENADVLHDKDNIARDNRLKLSLFQRKTSRAPKYRRRFRNEEGHLVYRDPDMIYTFVSKNPTEP
jgi:hypothetical protein